MRNYGVDEFESLAEQLRKNKRPALKYVQLSGSDLLLIELALKQLPEPTASEGIGNCKTQELIQTIHDAWHVRVYIK
jgi:hypothetical protein